MTTQWRWLAMLAFLLTALVASAQAAPPRAAMQLPCEDAFDCLVFVDEYYHRGLDRFFLTSDPVEQAALASGAIPGWQRATGGFYAFEIAFPPFDAPVCRFYAPPAFGDAHFLTAFREECAQLQAPGSGYVLESAAAFFVAIPDAATGACASGVPVYRLWNPHAGADHRYLTGKIGRDQLVDVLHWYVSEGYGPDGVAFCVVDLDEFGF
jgi:hypothetical protein